MSDLWSSFYKEDSYLISLANLKCNLYGMHVYKAIMLLTNLIQIFLCRSSTINNRILWQTWNGMHFQSTNFFIWLNLNCIFRSEFASHLSSLIDLSVSYSWFNFISFLLFLFICLILIFLKKDDWTKITNFTPFIALILINLNLYIQTCCLLKN